MPAKRFLLNRRALAVLAGLVATAVLIGAGHRYFRGNGIRRAALATAHALDQEGRSPEAIRHLEQFLQNYPGDVDALAAMAEITGRLALQSGLFNHLRAATQPHERLIRQAPDDPRSQEARRRLVELYLRIGDAIQTSRLSAVAPELAMQDLPYPAARQVADEMVRLEVEAARAEGRPVDPVMLRLQAIARHSLLTPGDAAARRDVIALYKTVLFGNEADPLYQGDPTDAIAAERLAALYLLNGEPENARRAMDDLLKAAPESAAVRLVRYRHALRQRNEAQAAVELEAAVALAPDNLDVRLAAAGDALRRGDVAAARAQLAAVPEVARDDLRVRVLIGLVEFGDERPLEAIDAWRQGLISTGGTSADLSWWLAYAQLQMNRLAEAQPLIAQYKRLAGEQALGKALHQLLQAEMDIRTARPSVAIDRLRKLVNEPLPTEFAIKVQMAAGRAQEALWNLDEAMTAYRRAAEIDTRALEPRLALAGLLEKRQPTEAVAELERALAEAPNEPILLIAMARARLREQAAKPRAADRDFTAFDAAWARAAAVAPNSSALVLLQADRLQIQGQFSQAVDLLGRAVRDVLERQKGQLARRNEHLLLAYADGLRRLGRNAEALDILSQGAAPDAFGDRATLRIAQAQALVALRRGREARALLDRPFDPPAPVEQSQAKEALGRLLETQGDLPGARTAYEQWARLIPDDPRPQLALLDLALNAGDDQAALALVHAAGLPAQVGEALKTSRNLRAIPGEKFPLLLALAQIRLRAIEAHARAAGRDQADDADGRSQIIPGGDVDQLLDRAAAEAPELPAVLILRGDQLRLLGDVEKARDAYRRALERGSPAALPRLVDLLTRAGRAEELAAFRQGANALRVDLLAAEASLLLGDRDRAIRFAAEAANTADTAPEVRRWQARILGLAGQVEQSEDALREVAERQPENLDAWILLLRAQATNNAKGARDAAIDRTIARVKTAVKTESPELLEARCLWAAGRPAQAERAFEAALSRQPNDPETLTFAALFFEEAGATARAVACLHQLLAAAPNRREAARHLAALLVGQTRPSPTDWDAAWAALGPESDDPSAADAEDRLARAVVLARAPDPARRDQAASRLRALLADLPAADPVGIAARKTLVRLLLDDGRPDQAREAAASLAALDDSAALALAAEALLADGRLDEADRQLDRLAALDPDSSIEPTLRARALIAREGPQITPQTLAARLNPALDRRQKAGGTPRALALGRAVFNQLLQTRPPALDAAETVAARLTDLDPGAAWTRATLLFRRGQTREALDLCEQGITRADGFDRLETARLACEIATAAGTDANPLARAEAIVETARAAQQPEPIDLLVMAALLRHHRGAFDDEARLYRTILQRDPGHLVAAGNLAWVLSEGLNQPSEALDQIDDLIRRHGRNPAAIDTRGIILLRLGRLDDAIRELEEAARGLPIGAVYFHLAQAHQKAGHDAEFRKYRDLARKAGLTPADVDTTERDDLAAFLNTP